VPRPSSRARDQHLATEFGRRVKALRTEAGMTQEALAERAGLHPTYISNTERGYSAPNLYSIVRLAEGLGLNPGELITDLRSQSHAAEA
jgi:transcriptional regulator with XRE-family HTH domain